MIEDDKQHSDSRPQGVAATPASLTPSAAVGITNVRIEVIHHLSQRYNTCGDWFLQQRNPIAAPSYQELLIRVSDTGNWKWNMALALHEFVEATLCTGATPPVTAKQVDDFDIGWDAKPHLPEYDEPGDDVDAPYHKQHVDATQLEMEFFDDFPHRANDWDLYERKLDELSEAWLAAHGVIKDELR